MLVTVQLLHLPHQPLLQALQRRGTTAHQRERRLLAVTIGQNELITIAVSTAVCAASGAGVLVVERCRVHEA